MNHSLHKLRTFKIRLMKNYLKNSILLTLLISMYPVLQAQRVFLGSCEKEFKSYLETDGKLTLCGINYTIEQTKELKYVLKYYHADTKKIFLKTTFQDKGLKYKDGLSTEWWDDGSLRFSGHYEKGKKQGFWIEDVNKSGFYEDDKKTGKWKEFREDSTLIAVRYYKDDKLHGSTTYYDSQGNVRRIVEYVEGEKVDHSNVENMGLKEQLPRYPSCENSGLSGKELRDCSNKALLQYVYTNVKYPKEARKNGLSGTVIIEFIVEKDGSITEQKTLRGISFALENEVKRLIDEMPVWIPGYQAGEAVRVKFTLPVIFKLE